MFQGKKKALTFSYDDGVTQDIRLAELFHKYGMKATFNLNSELLGKDGELLREGVVVSHVKIKPEDVNENITQEVAISDEFDSVAELRAEMKERGYDNSEYQVVYAYELWIKDFHIEVGRGLTPGEARKDLETSVNLSCMATVDMIKKHPERYYPYN